jgi:peptidoglycan hydrolase-like protein with peptidoglycan-binding domain
VSGVTRAITGGVIVIALAAGALWMIDSRDTPANATTTIASTAPATDAVTRRTLEHTEEFTGSLGYGDGFALPGQASGVVTWVPEKGTILRPGDLLYRVDERPTYWTRGGVPMYRALERGSEGTDVEQLQRYLQDGGYLEDDFEVDGEFGTGTRTAVKAWQDDHDLDKTGRIGASQLLFLPYDEIRVAAAPRIGEFAGGGVLEITLPDLFVSIDVGARKKQVFEGAPTIEVETADGTRYPATVESITAQQSQDAFGEQRYRVRLELAAAAGQEPGQATVEVIDVLAAEVLTVPVHSLLALVEGGYAVEVAQPDGTTEYRAVAIGAFADGWVEVSGDVTEDDQVVVP